MKGDNTDTVLQQLGEALHLARRRQDLTLQEVADTADVSYSVVSQVERGKKPQVTFMTVAKLATVLGISLDAVLAGNAGGAARTAPGEAPHKAHAQPRRHRKAVAKES
jgi:transcriptional regulator with XRE-family HTH domain